MMIADQCRALACRQFAASLNPLTSPERREHLASAASWNEQMAEAMDALYPASAHGADLRAIGDASGAT